MSSRGEICFDLQKPLVGRPAGRVVVSDFGEIRIEHRLLKTPIVFSADRLMAFSEVVGAPQSALPAFEREPRWLHLPRDGFTPGNIAFAFRAPVHVGPFARGANQLIPLRRGERRSGIDVDLLTVTVDDPAQLGAVMRGLKITSSPDLSASLTAAIPVVSPELEAAVYERRRRAARRTAWKVAGVGLMMAGLTGAQLGAYGSWETAGRFTLASVAAAVIVGVLLAALPIRTDDRRRSGLRWVGRAIAGVAALIGLAVAVGASDRVAGARYLLMWAAVSGGFGGYVVGQGLRGLASTRVEPVEGDLFAPRTGRRWGAGGVAVTLSIALIAMTAAQEQSAASVIEDVRAALLDLSDLPPGWSTCCGGDRVLRGDSLDTHVCGSDDDALPRHEASVERSFNLDAPGHPDLANAHFDLMIVLTPSVRDAVAEFEAIDSVDYLDCTAVSIGKIARAFQPNATDIAEAGYLGRDTIAGAPDVVIDRFHLRVPVSGTFDAMEGHFVRGRVGRAILRLPILVYVPDKLSLRERDDIVRTALANLAEADL